MAFDADTRQNPRLIVPDDESVSPKIVKIEEESFNIKPDVAGNNAIFIEDTWPVLAPVKFEIET